MNYLSIDYGLSKIGLAFSEGYLARPLEVISTKNWQRKISAIIENNQIDKIILGVSEGKSKNQALEFKNKLSQITNVEIILFDETLSSHEAIVKMIQSGKSQKYRRQMEDAAAAAVILQSYLDSIT